LFSRILTTFLVSYCVSKTAGYVFAGEGGPKGVGSDAEKLKKVPDTWKNGGFGTTPDAKLRLDRTIQMTVPIWIRQRQPPQYTAEDPEWIAFRKLQQDEKLLLKVYGDVARQVAELIKAPKYGPTLRDIGVDFSHISLVSRLEPVPPIHPPPVYEVPCIIVVPGSGQLTFGWRRLSDRMGGRMDRVFHPVVFAQAFYKGFRTFSIVSYLITRARIADMMNSSRGGESGLSLPGKQGSEETKVHMRLPVTWMSETQMRKWLPFLRGELGDQPSWQDHRNVVRSLTYRAAIDSGCASFRACWIQGQTKVMQSHVRDALPIEGSIVCLGERGKFHLDVTAIYSPETNALVGLPLIRRTYVVPDAAKWHSGRQPKGRVQEEEVVKSTAPPPLKQSPQPSEAHTAGTDSGNESGDEPSDEEKGGK
jgi:hypothetical protein